MEQLVFQVFDSIFEVRGRHPVYKQGKVLDGLLVFVVSSVGLEHAQTFVELLIGNVPQVLPPHVAVHPVLFDLLPTSGPFTALSLELFDPLRVLTHSRAVARFQKPAVVEFFVAIKIFLVVVCHFLQPFESIFNAPLNRSTLTIKRYQSQSSICQTTSF